MTLLLVGLDGADYHDVRRFWDNLPALGEIASSGTFCRLRSVDFPTSPAAWCSVYTGCLPEEHNITGFRTDGLKTLHREPLWDYLDCKIGLVNLPCVAAGDEETLDGFIVPGFAAASEKAWPKGLEIPDDYVIETTGHPVGRLRWLFGGSEKLTTDVGEAQIKFLRFNREAECRRVSFALELAEKFEVDLLFVGIMLLDRIGHGFAHHEWTMEDSYRMADELIGELMRSYQPSDVIVFSDHGIAPATSDRIPQTVLDNAARARRKNSNKLEPKGLHTLDGILVTNCRCDFEGVELRDIAPTVLERFGVSKPEEMSGKGLVEERMILESLRALGYV